MAPQSIDREREKWLRIARGIDTYGAAAGTLPACPHCDRTDLTLEIVPWPDGSHDDYLFACGACEARNVVTKPRAANEEAP